MDWLAGGTLIYSLFMLRRGIGLFFRARWAVWLAISESAFFIPIEIYELVRRRAPEMPDHPRPELFGHPKLGLLLVLALNVMIVWYLFENRQRLFRQPSRP